MPAGVPVTVLTGYLGSGKTTFVNFIVSENHGRKIAIIQNEYGQELGLEGSMVVGQDGKQQQEWLELPNGCLCCTVRDDLVATLEELLARDETFENIMIETSGLADPGPVAGMFWLDDALESQMYLDGIVTFIDAVNIEGYLAAEKSEDTVNEAEKQIALADLLVLNKTDLVSEKDIPHLTEVIRKFNKTAQLEVTSHSKLPLERVLGLESLDPRTGLEVDTAGSETPHRHTEDCDHDHKHDPSITTLFFSVPGSLAKKPLDRWLGDLLWDDGEEKQSDKMEIYRMKGALSVQGKPVKYSLQAVQDLFEIEKTSVPWGEEARTCKFVVIGRYLNEKRLVTGLESLVINS